MDSCRPPLIATCLLAGTVLVHAAEARPPQPAWRVVETAAHQTVLEVTLPREIDQTTVPFTAGDHRALAAVRVTAGAEQASASLGASGWWRGQRIDTIQVVKERAGTATVTLTLDIRPGPSPPAVRAVPWERKAKAAWRGTLVDSGFDARPPTGAAPSFHPTFRPSHDGSPVEYVIVTTDALAPAFQELADWKTAKGVQAVVRTTEWIATHYPTGVDQAEQVRFFLQDAFAHWGTLWALIGGDTDVVPARYATSRITEPPETIPTDLYYACLDGNWNGDGDSHFGEGIDGTDPGDTADLWPELYVGRAPVSTVEEATTFVHKVLEYERAPPVGARYPASVLMLGEELSPTLDGATLCEETLELLPSHLRVVRLYEHYTQYSGALPENAAAVIDSLTAGFGTVLHVGHGFRTTMSVGDGTLTNADADLLQNAPHHSLIYSINCSSAAIDFNAIGERFVKNASGGAVAYIGSSRLASVGAAQDFQNLFFEAVYRDSLVWAGQALAASKLPSIPVAAGDNLVRWMTMATVLLGDPELPVWHRTPAPLTVDHAGSALLGTLNLTATVRSAGIALAGARASLLKAGEAFATTTSAANGSVSLPFRVELPGAVGLVATHPGYLPYESTVTATSPSGVFLRHWNVLIDDTSGGNQNGRIEAGESAKLQVVVQNGGGTTATQVTGTITPSVPDPYLSVSQSTVLYPTLAPGAASAGTSHYEVTLAPNAPPAYQPVIEFTMASDQATNTDVFVVGVHVTDIEHRSHDLVDTGGTPNGLAEPGETVDYTIHARNNGPGSATELALALRILSRTSGQPSADATVLQDTATFGDLEPGVTAAGSALRFALSPTADIEDLALELSWSDIHGPVRIDTADLVPPGAVSNVRATGAQSSIRIEFDAPADPDIQGYDVYRASQPLGPYTKANTFLAGGSSLYEDRNLPTLTRFYYYAVARDSSSNASPASAIVAASTNPPLAPGWPMQTAQGTAAGVVVEDLDGDGDLEVITGSDALYAWHDDATEFVDGDQNPQTAGVFSSAGQSPEFGFHATPAVGDVDGDGDLELCGVAWTDEQVYLWEHTGEVRSGWPQALDSGFNWASPALADVDMDGDLEVLAISGLSGKVYGWHDDGTELADGDQNPSTSGVLFDAPASFLYASPGAGNVAGTAAKEIVIAANHAAGWVWVVDATGTVLPGWPFACEGQVTSSPALTDLDGDGYDEILVAAEDDSLYVIAGDGTLVPGWPRFAPTHTDFGHTSSVAVGELDGNPGSELVYAGADGRVRVFTRAGTPVPGWSAALFAQGALGAGATQCTPTIADVDGDGWNEVVLGAEDGRIYGWNHDGSELAGFPIALGGEVRGAVTLYDIDQDGLMEMATAAMDRLVYVWDLDGAVQGDRLDWPFFRHNVRGTGRTADPTRAIGIAVPPSTPAVHLRLGLPFPNPFNPRVEIALDLARPLPVQAAIYDVHGRLVRTLDPGSLAPGRHVLSWDGRNWANQPSPTGAYFLRVQGPDGVHQRRLTLIR